MPRQIGKTIWIRVGFGMWASTATPKQTVHNSQPPNRYVSSAPAPPRRGPRRHDRFCHAPEKTQKTNAANWGARRSSPLEPNALRPQMSSFSFSQQWPGVTINRCIACTHVYINRWRLFICFTTAKHHDQCLFHRVCFGPSMGPNMTTNKS